VVAAAPAPPQPAGTPEHPTVINRASPPKENGQRKEDGPPQENRPSAPEAPPTVEGAAKFGAPALKQAAEHLPPPASAPAAGAGQSIEVNLISMAGSPVAMLAGLAILAALTAGMFLRLNQHERAARAGAAARDFASLSLTTGQNALTVSPQVDPAVGAPPAPLQPGATSVSATSIPRNRAEALTVLGMGVTPDATKAAIKRIVDGLRMSWHPDHAKDEADRQLRELRLKQINAAWDILQGARAEA
jgi:hypothetical protein